MSTYYHTRDFKGNSIFGNFPPDCIYLLEVKEIFKLVEIVEGGKKVNARFGYRDNLNHRIFILTTEQKYLNSQKHFKELLKMTLMTLGDLFEFREEITARQNEVVRELIHNLTSLNTYNIHNLFSLIPQQLLTQNYNKQSDTIRGIIEEKPNVTVNTLLQLIKYNLAMKVEFSVFEKTMLKNPVVQVMSYPIRQIVLSVLQIFIADFDEKHIKIILDNTDRILSVDYDSLFVSFYYLFDNSIKYCCPNTTYRVSFLDEKDAFSVLFSMVSVRIEPGEEKLLCEKGFRGKGAKTLDSSGSGIGMYRLLKTLKLNNAQIDTIPRSGEYSRSLYGMQYETNCFKVGFLGQQNWFVSGGK